MAFILQIVCSLSCLIYLTTCLPVPGKDLNQADLGTENEVAVIQIGDDALRSVALDLAALKLEDLYEQDVINTALDILKKERKTPEKSLEDLQELGKTVRRDKRKVELLSAAIGASSGALSAGASGSASSGAGADTGSGESSGDSSGGSGSSSILSLLGPLLGSSSGGGGGGSGDDSEGGGGGGSNILSLLSGLLGSSSGGGGADGSGEGGDSSGGSGSSSILSLIGPLLGGSSGGGGGGGSDDDSSGGGGGGGSDSGAILNLIGPLLGSSSGGASSGAGAGDGHVSKDPINLLGDKVQLILRVKFAFLTKILQTLTGFISSSTQPQSEVHGQLVYPPPKKGFF